MHDVDSNVSPEGHWQEEGRCVDILPENSGGTRVFDPEMVVVTPVDRERTCITKVEGTLSFEPKHVKLLCGESMNL
jgi:hypothetical protein